MRVATVLALAALAGCAGPTLYDKPGGTQAQFDRDLAQCRYEAQLATSGYSSGNTRRGASGAAGQGVAEGIWQTSDRNDLEDSCLIGRGYTPRRK
jgi:hypothetical protein